MNQRKGENGRRNYFMINLHDSYVVRLGLKLTTPGSTVRGTADLPTEADVTDYGKSFYLKYLIRDCFKDFDGNIQICLKSTEN